MARGKRDSGEITFGSDSFLDVVANIVGILIILLVLVGVRVRNAPTTAEPKPRPPEPSDDSSRWEEDRARWETAKSKIDAENLAAELQQELLLAERARRIEQQAELARRRQAEAAQWKREGEQRIAQINEVAARQAEIDREAAALEQQIADSEAERTRLDARIAARLDAQTKTKTELLARIADKKRESADIQLRWQGVQASLEQDTKAIENMERATRELRRQLAAAKTMTSPSKTLIHRPTPLARAVETHELHFRCKNGRLAYTYLDELLEATRAHATARITPSTMRLEGAVGPIGGFRLRYVLARPPASMSEQLNEVLFRFSLIHWELAPDSDDIGESADDVLEPNSAFRVKLRSAPATKHAITLWIYPDSFSLAKRLEAYLQDQGYTVALRPLPDGIPIIGSPYGSATHSH